MIYVTIVGKGDQTDRDVKVERIDRAATTIFRVTDLETKEQHDYTMADIDFEHNALLRLTESDNSKTTIQVLDQSNDIKFDFYYAGGKVETLVYDEN